jgi:hypothetical protein
MLRTNEIANLCRATLRNKTASEEEKLRAKRALRRFEKMDVRRKSALAAIGEKPEPKDFPTSEEYGTALRAYRGALDRHIVERNAYAVLDDPNTSSLVRQRARERLAAIGLVEEAPLPIEAPKPPTNVATPRGWSDAERDENRRREQQFLDEIAEIIAESQKGKANV